MPNSATTPARPMKPTALATETLWSSHHSSHTPPITENGSVAITSMASSVRRNVR